MFPRCVRSVDYVWPQNTYIQWALKNWRHHRFLVSPSIHAHSFLSYAAAVIVGHAVFTPRPCCFIGVVMAKPQLGIESGMSDSFMLVFWDSLRMIGKQETGHDRYVTGWRFEAVLFGNTCLKGFGKKQRWCVAYCLSLILTTDSEEFYDNKSSN